MAWKLGCVFLCTAIAWMFIDNLTICSIFTAANIVIVSNIQIPKPQTPRQGSKRES